MDRGYDVTVLTAIPQYPLGRYYDGYKFRFAQWENMDGVRVLRVPIYASHDQSGFRRMLTYLSFAFFAASCGAARIGKPDLVYYFDNLPTTGLVARFIARLTGARTVQHIADMWPDTVLESGMLGGRTRRLIENPLTRLVERLYRKNAAISVLSPGFRRLLIERGVPSEKIHLIYNWVDETAFFPAPRDPSLAAELGFAGKTTVLYAGSIGPMQALHVAIEAAAKVRDLPNFELVVMGAGPLSNEVRAKAEELGASNVRFLPYRPVEQMNAINSAADALLIHLRDTPMLSTTIPSKTQVALACGRPVLMGVRGDAADIVRRSQGGIVFEPENAEAMAQAFRDFAAMSPESREEMGRRGRAFYVENMSLEAGAKITETMFRSVLGSCPDGTHC